MTEVVVDTPAKALAIYAHPDDADVSCGGTLARWSIDGAEVHVVVCALGDKGTTDPGADGAQLAAARAMEVDTAASRLGLAGHRLLGHPDGELVNDLELRRELVGVIRELRPQVLVCPDPTAVIFGAEYYNHRDHREVGFAALDATAPAAAMPLYFPDQGAAHQVSTVYLSGSLVPDVWVDVTATVEMKAEALACHRSQLGEAGEWMREAVRSRAEEAGAEAGVDYAEGFRRLLLSAS
jgi:LmbE family N-acetylglucosaminyl deacetylase